MVFVPGWPWRKLCGKGSFRGPVHPLDSGRAPLRSARESCGTCWNPTKPRPRSCATSSDGRDTIIPGGPDSPPPERHRSWPDRGQANRGAVAGAHDVAGESGTGLRLARAGHSGGGTGARGGRWGGTDEREGVAGGGAGWDVGRAEGGVGLGEAFGGDPASRQRVTGTGRRVPTFFVLSRASDRLSRLS
jgi:hypothetical protein